MSIQERIKQNIDEIIGKGIEESYPSLEASFDTIYKHAIVDYEKCREILQFSIGQLERIPELAEFFLLARASKLIREALRAFYGKTPANLDYLLPYETNEVMKIMEKSANLLPKRYTLYQYIPALADGLTKDERMKYANFVIDSIQRFGLQTSWDKNTIDSQMLNLFILLQIGVKENIMDLYVNVYTNYLDRLVTSGEHQLARDNVESLLIVGYNYGCLEDAYYGASRVYTLSNNVVAGLLYLNIALTLLQSRAKTIPQRFSFEILWQYLKIVRNSHFYRLDDVEEILEIFDTLGCNDYDRLSITHTAISTMIAHNDNDSVKKMSDFLESNREVLFRNLEHSAMPWFSLIETAKKIFPDANFRTVDLYMPFIKSAIEEKGNHLMCDIHTGENLSRHLKEILAKLNSTRNNSDYSHDNHVALIIASKLLSKAVTENNSSDFLLAMQPKSDFTFVKPPVVADDKDHEVKVEDWNAGELHSAYEDIDFVRMVLRADDNDAIMWIGKGEDYLYSMTLYRDCYNFEKLEELSQENVLTLQANYICNLRYERDVKPQNAPVYTKSDNELMTEYYALFDKLSNCRIGVPSVLDRLLIAKDMQVACFPHQLLIDNRANAFLGELKPSCNIISTEVLLKTNCWEPLSQNYSKSFWCPSEGGEFTFAMIQSQLEDILTAFNFEVSGERVPKKPLSADLNIVCAHGGANIGETEWFYENDAPIVETSRIVGKGKLLVLFVCHSGTINRTSYDNAMHTIVKRYIRMGYSSVVAPMWSLNTAILHTWLEEFMQHITAGSYVIDAVFKANKAVQQEFITPATWACLHLFGNPYLQIAETPRLVIEEEC